jgi:hypothetical protein
MSELGSEPGSGVFANSGAALSGSDVAVDLPGGAKARAPLSDRLASLLEPAHALKQMANAAVVKKRLLDTCFDSI